MKPMYHPLCIPICRSGAKCKCATLARQEVVMHKHACDHAASHACSAACSSSSPPAASSGPVSQADSS